MDIAQMQEIVDTAIANRRLSEQELDELAGERLSGPITPEPPEPGFDVPTPLGAENRQQAAQMALTRVATLRGDLGRVAEDIARARKEENKYLVEIYKKYAIPAACLIFVFVGAPLGILVRRGNFGVSAVIALGFYVLYWACLVVGEKLADRDILPPSIAMWLGDIVVGMLGIYLTMLVSREASIVRIDLSGLRRFFGRFRRRKAVEAV